MSALDFRLTLRRGRGLWKTREVKKTLGSGLGVQVNPMAMKVSTHSVQQYYPPVNGQMWRAQRRMTSSATMVNTAALAALQGLCPTNMLTLCRCRICHVPFVVNRFMLRNIPLSHSKHQYCSNKRLCLHWIRQPSVTSLWSFVDR